MVLTDRISNNDDGKPKKRSDTLKKQVNHNSTSEPKKSARLVFFAKQQNQNNLINIQLKYTQASRNRESFYCCFPHGVLKLEYQFNFFHNRNNFVNYIFFFTQDVHKDNYTGFKTEVPIYASVLFGDILVLKSF